MKAYWGVELQFHSFFDPGTRGSFPVWLPENKNKRRLKWVATLHLVDINTEAWSSGMGVGRGANNPTL
jgi:hypothetical protein